eukprot:12420243-Alexandrium_andersonii.AAC.1
MCWAATATKGRGRGAPEMGKNAMQQIGNLAVGLTGSAQAPSDGRERVRVGFPVRKPLLPFLSPAIPEGQVPVLLLEAFVPLDPVPGHPYGIGVVVAGLKRGYDSVSTRGEWA